MVSRPGGIGGVPALWTQPASAEGQVIGALSGQPYDTPASILYQYRKIPASEVVHTFGAAPPQGLSPSLLSDSDAFSAPTVGRGAVGLIPGVLTDSDAFSAPTLSAGAVALTPGALTDSDAFYGPILSGGAVAGMFIAYAGSSPRYRYRTIPSASVTDYILPGRKVVTPGLLVDTDSFFAPSSTYTLTGVSRLNDADNFQSPSITAAYTLLPSLLVDGAEVLFAPSMGTTYSLSPSLLVDSDSFSAPTVSLVGVDGSVVPNLLTDSDNLYTPVISATYTVSPGLLGDSDTFRVPVITTAVNVAPARLNDSDVFYSNLTASSGNLLLVLYADNDSLYSPTIGLGTGVFKPYHYGEASPLIIRGQFIPPMSVTVVIRVPVTDQNVTPNRLSDTDAHSAPILSTGIVFLSPGRINDTDVIPVVGVTLAPIQPLVPARINDTDDLRVPTLSTGAVNLSPAKFDDSDTLFVPLILRGAAPDILVNAIIDADQFSLPTLGTGAVNVSPAKFNDSDTFFTPNVMANRVMPSKFDDSDAVYVPIVTLGAAPVTPGLLIDTDRIFVPQISYPQTISVAGITDTDELYLPFLPPDLRYDYPIGHSLSSDYGIRKSRLGSRNLIIGRR